MADINPRTGKPWPLESRRFHAFREVLDADWIDDDGVVDCVICIQVPVKPGSPEPICSVCSEVRNEGHQPDSKECPCRNCLPVLPEPEPDEPNPPRRKRRSKPTV